MAAVAGVLLAALPADAAELNTLRDLKVVSTEAGAQVVVTGTQSPTFTVFRLSAPERLVVDLTSADATAIQGDHKGQGPVASVVAAQFSDERASVGRVLVTLAPHAQYDVRADGNQVVVSVTGAGAPAAPEPKAAAAEPKAPPAPEQKAAAPARPAATGENVVAVEVDEKDVARPARRLTGLTFRGDTLVVDADAEVARVEILELANPARLALDVQGVSLGARAPRAASALVRDVRAAAHGDKVRLVLEARDAMPAYRLVRTARGFEVRLGADAGREQPALAQAPAAPSAPAPAQARPAEVKDLTFRDAPSGGAVALKLSGPVRFSVDRPEPRSAVLTLEGAVLPKRLERSLDTTELETPVKTVSAFAVPGTGKVRVVVAADSALEEKVVEGAGGLTWTLTAAARPAPRTTEQAQSAQRTAGFSAEASTYVAEGAPRQSGRYTGKRVTFEFKDIDVQNLLRVIAEISRKNIVVADDVTGKVTIRLRNVPWDQALDLILRSKGLGKEEIGNIIRVAPLDKLEAEARLRAERAKSLLAQEELVVNLLPVNYATANDMQNRVKDVLSERGTVTVDTRTNVLIVKDVRANIERARALVRNLDTQTPQVLIESRIVEANTTFSRQLGVQWGGSARATAATGNPTGLIFPNNVAVTGGSDPGANAGTSSTPNFAVNLPAAVGLGTGGALGMVFGSAGGALALNLRLSAAENEGTVKTISSPRVTTLDNNTARISQGVSIPYSQVSASGANTTFVEARLSLEVTPHITQDGSILMSIRAENSQPDPANTGSNGQPAIQRKEATTQVLVKDGDTTVIGGIYVRRAGSSSASVPFLSKIPVLGFFFRNSQESDNRQELLIFITPRILNRQNIATNL